MENIKTVQIQIEIEELEAKLAPQDMAALLD